jgi:hypothetical protein
MILKNFTHIKNFTSIKTSVTPDCYTTYNGSDEYTDIDSLISVISADTTGTFGFYVTPDATTPTSTEAILSLGDTSAVGELTFLHSAADGNLYVILRHLGTQRWYYRTTTPPFSAGVKAHVGLTQDGTTPKIYINGSSVALTAITTTNPTHWIVNAPGIDNGRIACRLFNNSGAEAIFFAGDIDEIMYSSTGLSAAQMTALEALGSSNPDYSGVAGIQWHLSMDALNPTDKIGSADGVSYNQDASNIICV